MKTKAPAFMKLIIFLLLPSLLTGQMISITVKEYSSKKPLTSVSIIYKSQIVTKTNTEGVASFSNQLKNIKLAHPEYDTIDISLGSMNQVVYLSKMQKKLNEVKIKPKEDTFANQTIRRMINAFDQYHPNKSPNYKFYIYSKMVIDKTTDSLQKKDSSVNTELNSYLKTSKFFVWEKLTEAKHDSRFGEKKIVLNSNMSGFKEPIYELLALSLDQVNYLPRIFQEDRYKQYIFRYEGMDTIGDRKVFMINFFPQKKHKSKRSRSGVVYVDSITHCLMRYYGSTQEGFGEIENEMVNGYCFNKYLYRKSLPNFIQVNDGSPTFEYISRIKNLTIDNRFSSGEFKGNENDISISLNDQSSKKLMESIRGKDTLDARELNTFNILDSLVRKDNTYKKLRLALALTKGYVKFGKFNFSMNDLLQLNRFEGFRIQIGGESNFELSKKIYVNGYGAFGFKDQEFKFGAGLKYLLNYYDQSQLTLRYQKDVFPIGRNQSIFETPLERLSSLANLMYYTDYYKANQLTLGFQKDLSRHLTQKTWLQYTDIASTSNYVFQNKTMNDFNLLKIGIDLHWYPKSNFMTSSEGKFSVDKKPTNFKFSYIYHHPLDPVFVPYHSANLEFKTSIKNPIGRLEFTSLSGVASNQTPIYHLYEGLGTSPTNSNLLSSFGFSSNKNFVTMESNTFYSNYFTSVFFSQNLPRIRLNSTKGISTSIVYKALLGEIDKASDHNLVLISPSKLYQETGIEFNKLILPLGIGVYYRFGAYQLDGIQNNIAGRLKLNF